MRWQATKWAAGLVMSGLAVKNMKSNEAECRKRQNVIDWDTYFMATAFLARHRSKDPDYQVGACIVDDQKKIVGTGYNGFPIGCSDNKLSWDKNTASPLDKHSFVCHAETNAIIFRNTNAVKGCTMYVSSFPCNECAKQIIQSGIKKVIYFSDEKSHEPKIQASQRMFDLAGVEYVQFAPIGKVELSFSTKSLYD